MRDRGPARIPPAFIAPVGAHSVGDRGIGRPRNGLLRADRDGRAIVRVRGRA